MKIAIELHGNLRTGKHCQETLEKEVIEKNGNDADIFMKTGRKKEASTATWYKRTNQDAMESVVTEEEVKNIYGDNLVSLSIEESPKGDIGNYKYILDDGSVREISLQGITNMFLNIAGVNRMREEYSEENDIKYDACVITRPDIYFKEPFDIETLADGKDLSKYFFVCGRPAKDINDADGSFKENVVEACDLLLFSTPENMSLLFSDDNVEKILSRIKEKGKTPTKVSPEVALTDVMREELGIKVAIAPYQLMDKNPGKVGNFDILRLNQVEGLTLKNSGAGNEGNTNKPSPSC